LIDWLVKETFQPEKGLPVFEEVKPETFDEIQVDQAFGPIQKKIIPFLSSQHLSDKALFTALWLIQR
jgi:hypothetical protein